MCRCDGGCGGGSIVKRIAAEQDNHHDYSILRIQGKIEDSKKENSLPYISLPSAE